MLFSLACLAGCSTPNARPSNALSAKPSRNEPRVASVLGASARLASQIKSGKLWCDPDIPQKLSRDGREAFAISGFEPILAAYEDESHPGPSARFFLSPYAIYCYDAGVRGKPVPVKLFYPNPASLRLIPARIAGHEGDDALLRQFIEQLICGKLDGYTHDADRENSDAPLGAVLPVGGNPIPAKPYSRARQEAPSPTRTRSLEDAAKKARPPAQWKTSGVELAEDAYNWICSREYEASLLLHGACKTNAPVGRDALAQLAGKLRGMAEDLEAGPGRAMIVKSMHDIRMKKNALPDNPMYDSVRDDAEKIASMLGKQEQAAQKLAGRLKSILADIAAVGDYYQAAEGIMGAERAALTAREKLRAIMVKWEMTTNG